jgi:hypothetical protein
MAEIETVYALIALAVAAIAFAAGSALLQNANPEELERGPVVIEGPAGSGVPTGGIPNTFETPVVSPAGGG